MGSCAELCCPAWCHANLMPCSRARLHLRPFLGVQMTPFASRTGCEGEEGRRARRCDTCGHHMRQACANSLNIRLCFVFARLAYLPQPLWERAFGSVGVAPGLSFTGNRERLKPFGWWPPGSQKYKAQVLSKRSFLVAFVSVGPHFHLPAAWKTGGFGLMPLRVRHLKYRWVLENGHTGYGYIRCFDY